MKLFLKISDHQGILEQLQKKGFVWQVDVPFKATLVIKKGKRRKTRSASIVRKLDCGCGDCGQLAWFLTYTAPGSTVRKTEVHYW